MKKRANKILNYYLKKIDEELYVYMTKVAEAEPELIFLKQLRCLMTREFSISAVLQIWDYLFSGIEEDVRARLYN
jgi:hypothetical protein